MSKPLWILPILTILLSFQAGATGSFAHCFPAHKAEKPLLRDPHVLTSKEDLGKSFQASYRGDLRLKGRAFWDESEKSFVIPYNGHNAKIPPVFLKGLQTHIALALKNQYADQVFYPDLGHVHLLVSKEEAALLKGVSPKERIEKIFSMASLTALYHTAEMLQLKDGEFLQSTFPQDPWKLWRYFSRNLVGSFGTSNSLEVRWAGEKAIYNTVRGLPDKTEVSTLYFSANHAGCFEFKATDGTQFFDITFETIPYK